MEQSSLLSAKFDCPVVRQNISFLATAHDGETGFFLEMTNIFVFIKSPKFYCTEALS